MKIKILTLTLIAALAISCNSNTNKNTVEEATSTSQIDSIGEQTDVQYEIAKNYFVKNTVEDNLLTLKIESKEDFDKYFGMATTMGENGKPTPVDFATQSVIAVINKSASLAVTIEPQSLVQKDGTTTLVYKIDEGEKQTFKSRNALLLIVDKKSAETVEFKAE